MKINFDTANLQMTNTLVSKGNVNSVASANTKSTWEVGKALGDNNTYEGRKKTASELIQGIQITDVSVTQDYMTVMAHSMSSEDFGSLMKDGINPMDVNVEDSETILDHIKLYVAKGGTSVEGFTDSLDAETLKNLTGLENVDLDELTKKFDVTFDETTAGEINEATEKASEITTISDGMKVFLLNTDAELTIDTLYLAKHSAMNVSKEQGSEYFGVETKGYLVKKGASESTDKLAKEVVSLLEKTGLSTEKENVENGIWLVKNSIPVTKENLERLNDLNSIKLPISREDITTACVKAVSMGKPADQAILTEDCNINIYEKAVEIAGEMEGQVDPSLITRTRVFGESTLKMLSEANLMLLKSNYSIDTKDLEQYVEALKTLEKNAEFNKIEEFEAAVDTIEAVKTVPADALGTFAHKINSVSLEEIFAEGDNLRQRYETAGRAYEQLATEVRRDYGDSIKKAFRNVDDILEDLGYEKTDDNRRAVRILGYNSMSINEESVDRVREADRKVQSILTRISPMDTLSLIREGRSPIRMSVDELNNYLDEQDKTQEKEIEKYSKFLYKLEKNNSITESERAQYIEVYRLFHQLEKADMAAVGSIVNSGNELTIANLKTVLKSSKNRGMDVKIDDSFGFTVDEIRNEIEPERLAAIPDIEEMPLEKLYEELKEIETDKALDQEFAKEELTLMREAMRAPEEVVTELIMNRVSVSANTLLGMKHLMKQRGDAFSVVNDADSEVYDEIAEEIEEAMTDGETLKSAYDNAIDKAKDAVYEQALEEDEYIDVKSLQHAHIALSVARKLADSETYEIPVEIGGETTSINLKLVHNSSEEANVIVSFETEKLGRVSARLGKADGEIRGYISCNLKDTLSKMQEVADKLGKEVYTVMSGKSDSDSVLSKISMKDNDDSVSASELYETAKAFLEAVKGIN